MVGRSGMAGIKFSTPTLFRVDPANGLGQAVEEGALNTTGWGFDSSGRARVRLDVGSEGETIVQTRASAGAPWKRFWNSRNREEADGFYGLSAPDDAIMIMRKEAGSQQLQLKHLADGSITPLGVSRTIPPTRYIWDPRALRLAGWGAGGQWPEMEWFDKDVGAVHASLSKLFKDQDVGLVDWSADRTRFVLTVSGSDNPPIWYLFDKARRELSPLGEEYPELKAASLGKTRWITYKARDGLEIPAYVTLPPGATGPGSRLPLIILPHGGPKTRDGYDFDYLVQFLATRGYAVLRPQYRGSWGFGEALQNAGDGEWGGKMQTDLLDGIGALAADGTVDPRRVCIMGDTFGGYAALAGASLHPEAYACAISLSGTGNLKMVLSGRAGNSFRDLRSSLSKISYRDPRYDAMSPSEHVAAVRAPILLIWVDQDSEVSPEESERMRDALMAAHKVVETLVLKDADHDLQTAKARTQMLEALGTFLAKNLPVQAP